jgi:hypothetical protein
MLLKFMKQTSTNAGAFYKRSLVLILTICSLSFSQSMYAHSVDSYSGSCGSGPQYTVTATVSNVNSTSNYRWQWKNSAGTWVCFVNGANTINGNVYNVSGAVYNLTVTPGPIIFTNPNNGLQGLEIRMVISDGSGVNPCTLPAGNTWTSTTNHFINVSNTPCGGTSPCTAHITSLYFNKLSDNSHLPIANGSTFSPNQITNLYNLEVSTTGTVGSIKFTISGPTSSSNIENTIPYNSPVTGAGPWTGAVGSYSVNVKAYSGANATGSICHDTTINFTLANDCNCVNATNNLLANGSFENIATGWSVSGGTLTFGSANSYVMCGTYNGFLNWSSGTAKLWQDVSNITGGSVLTFKGYAGTHTPGISCSPKLSLIFLNSSNAVISQSDVTVTRDVDGAINYLELYTITATAPAGTVKVRVQASIGCNTMKVDGFCLTATPVCSGGGTWYLSLPSGTMGTSQTFTVNGKTITAYGFNNGNPGTPTALYGKNGGGDETGLGINSDVNFEIDINHFVQLDLNQIIAAGVTSGTMMVGSMQAGEPANVYGSNTLGVQGTLLMTVPVTLNNIMFAIPGFPDYRYISVQAAAPIPANVLLEQVSFSCPPPLGSIGDRVWNDVNKNGIQDAGEVGLSGITVSLYDTSNKIIASTVTDAYGNYKFSKLRVSTAGNNYQVRFSLPAEYKFAPQNADAAGVSGPSNSDADVNTGRTGNITLTTAVPDVTYADAGMYYAASARIGDFVWNDLNKNGLQEAGEPGIAGVAVMLYTSADVLYRSTITSNTGQYFFNDVAPGSYYVKINPPIGYKFSPKDAGADDVDSDIDTLTRKTPLITVVAGTINLTIDAGLNVTPPTGPSASLGDRVWEDLDGNNLQDIGEPGVANVTVQLYNSLNVLQATATTDAFGYYIFNGLVPGAYYVKFTLPSGYSFVTANAGADDIDSDVDGTFGANTTNSVTLADDDINTTLDAGLRRSTPGAALGDFVWYDLNKNGIQDGGSEIGVPGITVILYNSANAVVATTATDANGFYLFTGLAANTNYTVGFANLPAGYGFSPQNGAITVANNSDVVPGSGRTGTVTTGAAGTTVTYVDAGLVFTPKIFDSKASIGDYVWNDLNNDGKQDAGEPGLQGVTVTLFAADGTTVVATTTTDAQGYYIFTNLDAGSYVVGFSGLPAGYVFATKNAGANAFDELDSDADGVTGKTDPITLIAGEVNMTVDAGARNPVAASSIGDFVWNDLNNDGIQNAGEPGMEGISVTLLNSTGVAIKNTTTNASGKYLFTDLAAGTYSVVFGNLPVGFSATTKNAAGSNNTNNSDPGINSLTTDAIVLPANTNDPNWDMGIITTTRASVGDFVWNDINMNGKQDLGEPGIAGVTVTLYDNNNVPVSRTVTDATGFYLFSNLLPGTYSVGFGTIPAGSGFTVKNAAGTTIANDSDPDQATGKTAQFTLVAGQSNRDMDAGLVMLLAAVGDYVWNDANRDGLQDATEPGVAGITATLYSSTDNTIGNGDDIAVASAVTNAKGFYLINNIPVAAAGSRFYMRFTDLQGNSFFTTPLAGGPGASNDSKVTTQPATDGYTDFFNLTPGQIYRDVDAGVIRVLSIKGHIWHDSNALTDSTVNSSASLLVPPGAKPPAALRIHLVDANNNNTVIRVALVQRSITDSMDLFYEINDVPPGNYILVLRAIPVAVGTTDPTGQLPDGWKNTGEHLGLDKGWDSYPSLSNGISGNGKLTVILSTSDIINANFGIIKGFSEGHN